MREIKFRAWDQEKKKMFFQTHPTDPKQNIKFIFWNDNWYGRTTMGKPRVNKDHGVLMQYTGLEDKNGKEIYEGDIVKWKDSHNRKMIDEVKWVNDVTGFKPFMLIEADCEDYFYATPCEVIGNIYENSELYEPQNP